MIELTKTGIEGLDDILNGGIVKNSTRSEEHTSELQSHYSISYAV